MQRPLAGRVILIIEDEPLIALDVQQTFEEAGARVIIAPTVAAARIGLQEPGLSAAIVDHALGDGDSSEICDRLRERNVPFVTYSGFNDLAGHGAHAMVRKPTTPAVLVATIAGLLADGLGPATGRTARRDRTQLALKGVRQVPSNVSRETSEPVGAAGKRDALAYQRR